MIEEGQSLNKLGGYQEGRTPVGYQESVGPPGHSIPITLPHKLLQDVGILRSICDSRSASEISCPSELLLMYEFRCPPCCTGCLASLM